MKAKPPDQTEWHVRMNRNHTAAAKGSEWLRSKCDIRRINRKDKSGEGKREHREDEFGGQTVGTPEDKAGAPGGQRITRRTKREDTVALEDNSG